MNPVINIHQLCFSYGPNLILKEIDLKVFPNEYVGIIGPNGGGKTTLLKCIMGFLHADSGRITIPTSNTIGYVPQKLSIDLEFPITVKELILTGSPQQPSLWRQYSKQTLEKAQSFIHWLELEKFENLRFGELSGGIAQRVLLARALICDPSILILDEPMAHIDLEAIQKIRTFLKELSKKITILLVTHDLNMVLEDVSKVVCIEQKATLYSPSDVCTHFAHGVYHSKGEE